MQENGADAKATAQPKRKVAPELCWTAARVAADLKLSRSVKRAQHCDQLCRQPIQIAALHNSSSNSIKTNPCLAPAVVLTSVVGLLYRTFLEAQTVHVVTAAQQCATSFLLVLHVQWLTWSARGAES